MPSIRSIQVLWIALVFVPGLLAATASAACAAETEFGPVIDVCEATTLDEAAMRGERLGWPVAPEDTNWRRGFERHIGGSVRVVGWRRTAREGDGLLSYWTASGPNPHTACAFSTGRPGLLEALRNRFGPPDTFEPHGDLVNASWSRGTRQISFSRVGRSSVLNLSSGR